MALFPKGGEKAEGSCAANSIGRVTGFEKLGRGVKH